jgi:hypothetical protein
VDQPTIQAGIDAAVSGVDEVVVAPGTYSEIIDFHGKMITVRSSDPADPAVVAATVIDATLAADPGTGKPVVRCDSGEGAGTVLSGFTLTGGTGDTFWFSTSSGGGMFCRLSHPTVTHCVFTGNTAADGGGMFNHSSSPKVTHCTFSANTATDDGGGMHNDGSSPAVTHCWFGGNSAVDGGGMYNASAAPAVSGCVFDSNSASVNGGGMYGFFGTPVATNCTFGLNTAGSSGGGVYSVFATTMVRNSILWGNSDSGGMDASGQFHWSGGSPAVNYSDVQGGWMGAGGVGNLNMDPMFVNAAGGDFHLMAGSACIDAGDNLSVPGGLSSDLDGEARFVDDPDTVDTGNGVAPVVDMGAYEVQVIVEVPEPPDPPEPPVSETPEEMLGHLMDDLSGLDLPKGTKNSLMSKLDSAMKALSDSNGNNDVAACNSLGAFVNAVNAQNGKKIDEADAEALVAAAEAIMEALGCS